jgi:sn-glycerol 3-phosphate transport system substrate-binding protein
MLQRKLILAMVTLALLVLAVAPATVAQDEPIEITAWIAFTDHRFDWATDVANQFNAENPGIVVSTVPYADYEPLLNELTLANDQGGDVPEIVQLFEVATQFALDSNWFQPVAEIIDGRDEVLGQPVALDDIVEVVSAYYTIDGEWASVPWNTSTPILYANRDLMDQVGLEELPTTWGEMKEACAAFDGLIEDGTVAGCVSWPNHGWFLEQWLAQQNEMLTDNSNGREGRATRINLTSDAALDIAQFHQDMYTEGYYAYSGVQRDWSGVVQAFSAQQIPFAMTSSASAAGIINNATENGFTVDTGFMVYDEEDGWTGNILGGATMWVSDGLEPEVADAAVAFLLYFSNTANSASWHTASGYVPVRTSSIELLENLDAGNSLGWSIEDGMRMDLEAGNWFEQNPNFRTASEQLGQSQVTLATQGAIFGTFVETRDLITQALEDVMLQGSDVAETMAAAEEEANILLEEYNLLYVGE